MNVPKPAKYIADFEQLGLGLFIHWGLYSQLGQGEWICYMKNMEQVELLLQIQMLHILQVWQ